MAGRELYRNTAGGRDRQAARQASRRFSLFVLFAIAALGFYSAFIAMKGGQWTGAVIAAAFSVFAVSLMVRVVARMAGMKRPERNAPAAGRWRLTGQDR